MAVKLNNFSLNGHPRAQPTLIISWSLIQSMILKIYNWLTDYCLYFCWSFWSETIWTDKQNCLLNTRIAVYLFGTDTDKKIIQFNTISQQKNLIFKKFFFFPFFFFFLTGKLIQLCVNYVVSLWLCWAVKHLINLFFYLKMYINRGTFICIVEYFI